jgi:hypothetical protein
MPTGENEVNRAIECLKQTVPLLKINLKETKEFVAKAKQVGKLLRKLGITTLFSDKSHDVLHVTWTGWLAEIFPYEGNLVDISVEEAKIVWFEMDKRLLETCRRLNSNAAKTQEALSKVTELLAALTKQI